MEKLVQLLIINIFWINIFFFIHCKKENIYESTDPNIKMQAGVLFYGDKFLTGVIKEEIPALSETHYTDFRNGIQHGEFKNINKDGILLQSIQFKNGQKEGISKAWFANGRYKTYSEFKAGHYINERMEWYDTGKIYTYEKFDENGKILVAKKWYKEGKIYMNVVFRKDGSMIGLPGSKICRPIQKLDKKESEANETN